ncbi:MAG: hypothetical protein R3B48_25305 [Kofleriaceae bacterium]
MSTTDSPPSAPASAESSIGATAIAGAIVVAMLFALFYLASTPAYRAEATVPFLLAAVLITAAVIAATQWPRYVGHGLALAYGICAPIGAYLLRSQSDLVLVPLFLAACGVLALVLTPLSYHRKRAAWAFLLSLLVVMAVCTLFGAPKIRANFGVSMWIALMIPGLLGAASVGLGMLSGDYQEGVKARR